MPKSASAAVPGSGDGKIETTVGIVCAARAVFAGWKPALPGRDAADWRPLPFSTRRTGVRLAIFRPNQEVGHYRCASFDGDGGTLSVQSVKSKFETREKCAVLCVTRVLP